jgi:mono/diheme cytochrome c family protein
MTFRVPLMIRIAGLVLATTGFYTYVGQMVPQKEVQPPQDATIRADMTSAEMATVGRQIMEAKGFCLTCHTIGKAQGPYRFPDLAGVDSRVKSNQGGRLHKPGMTDVDYFAEAMYEPTAYVVEGFPPAMPPINKPPIGLNDQEILCVIAYLQTLGGTPTVTMQTKHAYNGGAAAVPAGAAPAPKGSPQ